MFITLMGQILNPSPRGIRLMHQSFKLMSHISWAFGIHSIYLYKLTRIWSNYGVSIGVSRVIKWQVLYKRCWSEKREHFKSSLIGECGRLWRGRGELKNKRWESRRLEKSCHRQKPEFTLFFIILINKTSSFYFIKCSLLLIIYARELIKGLRVCI